MKERLQLMNVKLREAFGKLTEKFTKKTLIIFGAAILAVVCIIFATSGKKESKGLEYVLVNDFLSSGSYEVVGIGTCNDKDIVIPEEHKGKPVTSIAEEAFKECVKIKSVTIPGSVVEIGDSAFEECRSLKAVTIPKSIKEIGNKVFYGCVDLTSITIPDSVTSIRDRAFSSCSSLTSISVEPENAKYKSIDGNLYTKDGKSLIQYAIGKTGTTFAIPYGVTSIADSAFNSCDSLTSITIPNSVTSIGSYAFHYCSSLTSITIPNSVTSIGSSAFDFCSSLTSITIPNSVTSIGSFAFYSCESLTSITIPNSVTSIGGSAFGSCSSLTSITIPNSVTSIGSYAFSRCSSLTNIKFEGNIGEWHAIDKGDSWNGYIPATEVDCLDGKVKI